MFIFLLLGNHKLDFFQQGISQKFPTSVGVSSIKSYSFDCCLKNWVIAQWFQLCYYISLFDPRVLLNFKLYFVPESVEEFTFSQEKLDEEFTFWQEKLF